LKAKYLIGGTMLLGITGTLLYTLKTFNKCMGRAEDKIPSRDSKLVKEKLQPYADEIYDGVDLLHGENSEIVYTESFDGLKLAAICLPAKNAKATIILMHGFRSTPYWDFAGAVRKYSEKGMNLVLPYQRAHGKSEGKYLTFGVKERRDVHSWIEWVKKRFGDEEKILVDGMSMGSATVLMASELGYPENVKGIIADCGYTSPYDIVSCVMQNKMHIPKYPFIWLYDAACRVFADFSLKECSATDAMKVNAVPVLFAHGEADDFVPYWMTKQNYDACTAQKVFVSVPEAGHGMCYLIDRERYDRELDRFITDVLGLDEEN
jgi:fermentation-respiration switch protein FrsA (DUF1100 family)